MAELTKYFKKSKPLCDGDCWHYSSFGGVEGCGVREEEGNYWPEEIQTGDKCLYPEKKDVCEPVFVGSILGFCAALEGTVIDGGLHDNTKLVKMLTNSKD